jgi:hypothetical protein
MCYAMDEGRGLVMCAESFAQGEAIGVCEDAPRYACDDNSSASVVSGVGFREYYHNPLDGVVYLEADLK